MAAQSYKLVYFNFRGRAEITRMLFSLAKQPFQDHRIELAEWPTLKPQTMFQKLPYLEVTDEATKEKTTLAQSISISRFVANKFNLAGKSDLEKAQCDMIIDQIVDVLNALTKIYMDNMTDETKLMAALKEAAKEAFPNQLKGIETILANNTNKEGFLVGNSLTYADLHMIIFYDSLRDDKQTVLEKLPLLKKHDEMIRSIPDVAEHIKRNSHVRVSIKW